MWWKMQWKLSKLAYKGCMQVMFRHASFLFLQENKDHIPVQVFHDIGAEEFNKLYGLLSQAKLKCVLDFTDIVTGSCLF